MFACFFSLSTSTDIWDDLLRNLGVQKNFLKINIHKYNLFLHVALLLVNGKSGVLQFKELNSRKHSIDSWCL